MSTCSPRYKNKNDKRMEGPTQCDHQCIHWKACWEELRGGSERVYSLMSDRVFDGTAKYKRTRFR